MSKNEVILNDIKISINTLMAIIPEKILLPVKSTLLCFYILNKFLFNSIKKISHNIFSKNNKSSKNKSLAENILCFTTLDWDELYHRPRHIMKYLSDNNMVLYIGSFRGLDSSEELLQPVSKLLHIDVPLRNINVFRPFLVF